MYVLQLCFGRFPASYFERYVARVEDDLRGARALAAGWGAALPERVDSIYLGGGTPSLLPAELLRRLFAAIRGEFAVEPDAEITVECAPGQFEDEALAAMVACGVNRVSFGVQSFVDEEARRAGRLHTRAVVLRDVERVRAGGHRARESGPDCGAGGADAGFVACVARSAVRRGAGAREHLYAGGGRGLAAGAARSARAGQNIRRRWFRRTTRLRRCMWRRRSFWRLRGLAQYEISNFARGGGESLHNLKYWRREPYLGLGLDAHSMLRDADGRALRFATTDELEPFLGAPGWGDPERLTREAELEEAWFLGLRLNAGVELAALREEFGAEAVARFDSVIAELVSDGLMECSDERVGLTLRGRLLSNEAFERFLGVSA